MVLRAFVILCASCGAAIIPAGAAPWDAGVSLVGRLEAYAVEEAEGDPARARGEATAAGELATEGTVRLVARAEARADTAGWYGSGVLLDVLERRAEPSPLAIPELYVHARRGDWDLRVGKIVYGWGSADGFNPTDNLNPRDYTDVLRADKLGAASAHALWQRGPVSVDVVLLPFGQLSRLPGIEGRFAPALPGEVDNPFHPAEGPRTLQTSYEMAPRRMPGPSWRTLGEALRVTWKLPGSQVSAVVERLVSDLPAFDALPVRIDLAEGRLDVRLTEEAYRQDVVGIDFQSALGELGLRGEAARLTSRDPRAGDELVSVFGVDRRFGDVVGEQDLTAIVSFLSRRELRAPEGAAAALGEIDPEWPFRQGILAHLLWEVRDGLSVDVSGFTAFGDGSYQELLLSYRMLEALRLEAKIERLAGPRGTFLGAYQDDSRAFLQVTYAF